MPDDVTREIEVDAPAEEVWRSLTDPELLAGWLADDATLELTPGGELAMRTPDGEERTGWVEQADPPRWLSFWWRRGDSGETTRVELELEESAGGTRVRVTESRPLVGLELRAASLAEGTGSGDPDTAGGGAPGAAGPAADARLLVLA